MPSLEGLLSSLPAGQGTVETKTSGTRREKHCNGRFLYGPVSLNTGFTNGNGRLAHARHSDMEFSIIVATTSALTLERLLSGFRNTLVEAEIEHEIVVANNA